MVLFFFFFFLRNKDLSTCISWRGKGQPTPGFLPGKCHGHRSLAGYSPRGLKESDTTERPRVITRIGEFAFHTLNLGVGGGPQPERLISWPLTHQVSCLSHSMCPAGTPSLRAPRSPAATPLTSPPTTTASTAASTSPITASATTPGPTTCTTRRRGCTPPG